MRNLIKLAICFTFVFVFSECKEENIILENLLAENEESLRDASFQSKNFGKSVQSNFFGVISEEFGEPLSGVRVRIGDAFTFTDRNGVFVLNDVTVFENFAYIVVEKEGFLRGSKVVIPKTTGSNRVEIELLKIHNKVTINSGQESAVRISGSNNLAIFPGDFKNADGTPYNGQIDVVVQFLRPFTLSIFDTMQGALFGRAMNDESVVMETYGMVVIKLFSQSGNEVFVDESSPAKISIPVDTFQSSFAPDSLAMWYFDESLGYWKEQGQAVKDGSSYIGEIANFSTWNFGVALSNAKLDLLLSPNQVPNETQTPYRVFAQRTKNDLPVFSKVIYSGEETASVYIPGNDDLKISVTPINSISSCTFRHEENAGSFSMNSSIDIGFEKDQVETTTFTGTVTNCDGNPLTNGYVYVDENYVYPINDGIINIGYDHCSNSSVSIQIYDTETDRFAIDEVLLNGSAVDLGSLSVCDNSGGIYNGDVVLSTQEELNDFGSFQYKRIQGQLFIGVSSGNPSNITDLSPLSDLEHVESLIFANNSLLTNLEGLPNIAEVNWLTINNNDQITSLSGLENITKSLWVNITGNDNLNSLQGLRGSMNRLFIRSNNALESLTGLENVTSIEVLDVWDSNSLTSIAEVMNISNLRNLTLDRNPVLASLEGLENYSSLNWLNIARCDALEDLSPLSNLTSLDYLFLAGNQNLKSLTGLENVVSNQGIHIGRYVQTDIFVNIPNPSLTDYCALQNLFSNGTYNDPPTSLFNGIYFINNPFNPTIQDIIDGNCKQ